jgi:hypothetical protein
MKINRIIIDKLNSRVAIETPDKVIYIEKGKPILVDVEGHVIKPDELYDLLYSLAKRTSVEKHYFTAGL